MKVWVVMGNDYPDAVFDSHKGAMAHIESRAQEDSKFAKEMRPKIYWRAYEFELHSVEHLTTL